MIKKTAVLTATVDKNFGNINGLLHSILISNPENESTEVTIKTNSIILWIGNIPAKSTKQFIMETIINEAIIGNSSKDHTNIILNIIETT